tara:strand:- start:2935 stop:3105 length:171 start_codon:yes stop_codon:yes gene_type:complete
MFLKNINEVGILQQTKELQTSSNLFHENAYLIEAQYIAWVSFAGLINTAYLLNSMK